MMLMVITYNRITSDGLENVRPRYLEWKKRPLEKLYLITRTQCKKTYEGLIIVAVLIMNIF